MRLSRIAREILACAAALLLTGGTTHAAFVTFTRSADFFAAIGSTPSFTETYEGVPLGTILPTGTTLNGITYGFPTDVSGLVANNFSALGTRSLEADRAGTTTDFFLPGESISLSFSGPVFGLGVFFNAFANPPDSLFAIATSVGTATTGGPITNRDIGTFYFAGILSDTPFTTGSIGSSLGGVTYTVDNLTIVQGPVAIPEPSSFVLLTVAAVGLLAPRLRRRRVVGSAL